MKLSVVIPVFNEKDTIKDVIEKVKRSPVKKGFALANGDYIIIQDADLE